MLDYFQLQREKRKTREEEPKTLKVWISHGLSEFFGTIILSLALAGLSISVGRGRVVEHYFLHPILVSFYAGFIAVGFVLVVFLRWSADLNPAVTITRVLRGRNTYRYGLYKVTIQMVAAIVTGLIIYGLGKIQGEHNGTHQITNHAIDAYAADGSSYISKIANARQSVSGGSVWIFLSELLITSTLLFPIFSKRISDRYRDVMIMFIISIAVGFAILNKTAAINPARGLAQQVPGLFFGYHTSASHSAYSLNMATIAMLAGTFGAPFFYVFVQGATDKFNIVFTSMVRFKNYRSDNMKYDDQNNKQNRFSK